MDLPFRRFAGAWLAFSFLFCLTATAADSPPKLRLSEVQQVKPTGYRVELTLDPDKETFSGSISIRLDIQHPIQVLWLNATKIAVQNASLTSGGEKQVATVVAGDPNFLGLKFSAPVAAGAAEVRIDYTGTPMLDGQSGIFRTEDAGNRYLLTQFEQIAARRAFPCFDEPSYKVPWQLTLHVPAQDSVVSNTPVLSERTEGASKTFVFEQTKPLPSYLVAFGVGPFEFVNAGFAGKNHVPVRIVTAKGRADEAAYAARVTATILTRLEDYFGVPYPYSKADQVAIPISAGFAMENAGMVTYGQTIILAKPRSDTEERQRLYASFAAHELAHQWFGDLVTTAWWNDIWLNEAFATWMANKLIAAWKPEWGTRAEDVSDKLYAENRDSLLTARKIRQNIESNDDIENAFDGITYQKGAAVIGMFENWLGPEAFRNGVHSYMERYAFRTATTSDFLDSVSTAARKNVTEAFSTFLDQSGVPLVSIALDCKQHIPALRLAQQRYLPLGSKSSGSPLWEIPVCVRYGSGDSGRTKCLLMTRPIMDVPLETNSCPTWVQANDKAVGYYRVNYAAGLMETLLNDNAVARLSAPERVDLIGNARALTDAGTIPAADALKLVAIFHADPERHVVDQALKLAISPVNYLVRPDLQTKYAGFIRTNFAERAREIGWTPKSGESDEARLLRPTLLLAVATFGRDDDLAKQARSLADKWLSTRQGIEPSLIASILKTAAYSGDTALAEHFVAIWPSLDPQQQESLLQAMFGFRDPQAIRTLFEAVLSGKLPATPASYLLYYAGRDSSDSRGVRFEFLKAHYDRIVELLGESLFSGKSQLPNVGAGFCDPQAKIELERYFEHRVDKLLGAPRVLAHVLESIDQCIAIKSVQEPSVTAFLQNR
ncbi:MAG TPA: M1 family metallopeptidase [Bryobacteraceae bacterium]|nr:M1 family metallopeptidase [Bryobacteraceae bacterium]